MLPRPAFGLRGRFAPPPPARPPGDLFGGFARLCRRRFLSCIRVRCSPPAGLRPVGLPPCCCPERPPPASRHRPPPFASRVPRLQGSERGFAPPPLSGRCAAPRLLPPPEGSATPRRYAPPPGGGGRRRGSGATPRSPSRAAGERIRRGAGGGRGGGGRWGGATGRGRMPQRADDQATPETPRRRTGVVAVLLRKPVPSYCCHQPNT